MKALDKIDKKLLTLLQEDAKQSTKELALKVGLSASPTFERIKRLEQSGLIKSYVAICDNKKLGKPLEAFCQVSLQEHSEDLIKRFQQKISQLPAVSACYHVSGNHDYLLKLQVKDMETYQAFIVKQLSKIPNVSNVHSLFVMGTIKEDTAISLSDD
jgi:Lrp/AsnC family leucine-responsive transcriptional regulator